MEKGTLAPPTSTPPFVHPRLVEDPKPREWWHPKITIYRFLVLLTTIGLGWAKAAAVHRGDNFVSTTIEWVAGVAVYLVLFVIGELQSASRPNPYFAWLVNEDIILRPLLTEISKAFSLQPATRYRSDGLEPDPLLHGSHPPITGYRVLVSTTTILFGMAKAVMSYLGLSASANATDWTFGVVLTAILYCVGLYEDNPVGILPSLFETNYQPVLSPIFFAGGFFTLRTAFYLGAMSVVVAWCTMWTQVLQTCWIESVNGLAEPAGFFGDASRATMRLTSCGPLCLFIAMGVVLFSVLLKMLIVMFGRVWTVRRLLRGVRQVLILVLQQISRWLSTSIYEIPAPTTRLLNHVRNLDRFVRRFIVHILVFSLGGIACTLYAYTFLSLPFRITWYHQENFFLYIVSFVGFVLFFPLVALGSAVVALQSFRALVEPFFQDWNAPGYVAGVLEDPFSRLI